MAFITGAINSPVILGNGTTLVSGNIDDIWQGWILDTGASHHITADISCLSNLVSRIVDIKVGGGQIFQSSYSGLVRLSMVVSGIKLSFVLHDVLYMYNWNEANLLSWRKLDLLSEFYLLGQDGTLEVKFKKDHSTILRSTLGVHVYTLESRISKGQVYVSAVQFWHEALGHSSPRSWTKSLELYSDSHILPKSSSNFYCHKCATMNMKRHVPSSVNSLSKYPYDLVYADLSGPISPQSIGSALYTLALLDDCTRFGEIFFLKHKSDAIKCIKTFCEKIFN